GNGSLRLYVRDGTFSAQLLDQAGLNVGSIVIAKLFGNDKEVQLRCAVADLNVQQGMARPRMAKLATTEAVVEATGEINLAQEQLDLRIVPESLKWKFFSLRTPLHVRGSFAKPDVGLEPGPLAARAGAAVAAAVFAPAALALVPLTVPAADDDVNCKQLLAQVRNR
ncbi:MAG: AsmA family protein, partial [Comamonas testosteroni]